jgi:hypothetical protein
MMPALSVVGFTIPLKVFLKCIGPVEVTYSLKTVLSLTTSQSEGLGISLISYISNKTHTR